MKIKDFIAALQKFDPELQVFTYNHEWRFAHANSPKEISSIEILSMKISDAGIGEWSSIMYDKGVVV